MYNSVSKAALLIVAVIIAASGCGNRAKKVELATGPDMKTLPEPSHFAAAAIEAAGGVDTWANSKKFELDCVVTFYQSDGAHYLTEQRYVVYPWSGSIEISGVEPKCDFLWRLSGGAFGVVRGSDKIDRVTDVIEAIDLAEALLTATSVPAALLDTRWDYSVMDEPVKLQGRLYSRIKRTTRPDLPAVTIMPEVIMYQNQDTSLVDRVWMVARQGQKFLSIMCYDYREISKGGILAPKRIEVFETNEREASPQRLIKIDVK